MTLKEAMLYHQIHPAKLLTDFGTSFASSWLLWDGRWAYALSVDFLPSLLLSAVLVRFAELESYRRTSLGSYIASYMTPKIVAARSAGQLIVWAGAAIHVAWLLPFGYFVILLAWLNGLWAPKALEPKP